MCAASTLDVAAADAATRAGLKKHYKEQVAKAQRMAQGFDDATRAASRRHSSRASRETDKREITKPADVDANAESRIVSAAKAKQSAVPGPRVAHGDGFISSGHMSALKSVVGSVQDPRKHTLVTQHIVLGCREDAMDLAKLKSLGVTHVLNTCKQLPNYHKAHLIYYKIPLMDRPNEAIVECCEVASHFLQRVERVGGRVLVHCIAGSSRSVTVVLMHLMLTHRITLHEAFHHINRMRPQADPNEGFKLQLALLELKILGGSSVAGKDAGRQWSFYEWNVRKSQVNKLATKRNRHTREYDPASAACALQ